MVNKYVSAVVVGIVGCIVVGLLSLYPCCVIFSWAVMAVAGAVAVLWARSEIEDAKNCIIVSGLTGGISGLGGAIIGSIGFAALILATTSTTRSSFSSTTDNPVISIVGYAGICIPVQLVLGIILGIIGGYICYTITAKKSAG